MSRHRRRRKHGKAFGFSGLKPASHDTSSKSEASNSASSASAPSAPSTS